MGEDNLARADWLPAAAAASRDEKRRAERRKLKVPCHIRYVVPGVADVCHAGGRARDISRSGLGLLVKQCLAGGTPLLVTVSLSERQAVDLTGSVAFSRHVHLGWYIVGVRLEPVSDPRLSSTQGIGRPYVPTAGSGGAA